MKVGVVLNPIAGGGGLARARSALEAALGRHFAQWEIRDTVKSGDGEALALALAADGCDVVIAAGGDGTTSEVASGLVRYRLEHGAAAMPVPALGLLPCGTGTDFARGQTMPRDIEAAIARIAQAAPRAIDAGKVTFVDDDGAQASRYFLNISSVGLSGPTTRAVNKDKRKGKGSAKLLFLWRTVVEFSRFRFQQVRISVDDAAPIEARIALAAVCNGRFFGGGMMIAPDADLQDGKFDVVIVRASGKLGLIWDLRLVYGGKHRNHHAITIQRASRVLIEPVGDVGPNGVQAEVDGEPIGRCPARYELLPSALLLRA